MDAGLHHFDFEIYVFHVLSIRYSLLSKVKRVKKYEYAF